ncbi:MAG: C25 family cysteine peptidase, partial [Acidobacteriota bacterium]
MGLVCSPDTIGPGDYVDCTLTYTNSGNGPADNIEYRIDFPDTGSVSLISTNGTDSAREWTGDANGTGGSTNYIQLVPNDATPTYIPALANIPTPTTQTMNFRFTSSDSTPDGSSFTITAYTWFNNGTQTSYQGQLAADTTQITPAIISDFTTHRHRGQTLVQWQTAAETGTAGFYLERKDPANGQWVRVNEGLLPALIERPGGGTYAFLDSQAKPMTAQTYRLVAVDFTGSQEIHGPYERIASRSSGLENFDAKQSKGFARTAHQPSTAEVAAWDRKREARIEELSMTSSAKGLTPTGAAALNARIRTEGEGLFSLSAVTLADHFGMGVREVQKAFRTGKLRLSHHGSPVAYLPSDDLDRVYFFGQSIDSRFTDENTYWATFANRAGTPGVDLMDEIGGFVPPAVTTPQTFLSTTTFEEDIWLVVYAVQDPEADIWFGGFVSTGYYGDTTFVTDVTAPDAAADGQAEIRLQLYGLTNLTAGDDHHAEVRLNGALIGEAVWDGVTPQALVATFDQSILNAGNNSLEVNGVLDGDVEQSSFVIDTVDLAYNRHYSALNDQLIFGANGHRAITVDGFTGPDVEVFDLHSATRPIHLTGTTVEDSDAGYRVTFAPSSVDGLYLAVRRAAAIVSSSLEIDRPSKLRSPDNAAEYVVIAPASLQTGAQSLVEYRQQRFPDARLIDLQDVYDEFNGGIEDPSAIRSFLKYALASWQTAPRFVVLAGKGTLDPKDIQGYGTNVLPLVLASTPHGVFASDTRIGDVVGSDGVPDVAIGRIPALSSNDLENYVDKLRRYEASDNQGDQNALMLADNADGAGNFPADSLNVGASLPAHVTPIHVVHQAGADAGLTRQQVSNALDQGIMLFNFIGHGAVTQLGSEAFWA